MAHIPPIMISELEKKGLFKESDFYLGLSQHCKYIDPKAAKEFYLGFVTYVSAELRKNGTVMLPELGYFALVKQKQKVGWAGQFKRIIEGAYMLKFYPKDKWRDYFSKLAERPGLEGRLDPREKILNMEL